MKSLLVIGLLITDDPMANTLLAILLYKVTATMLVESCALFTVNLLLVVGLLFNTDNPAANTVLAILAEIQVRVFPQPRPSSALFNITMD